jgi:hypothetical protein
MLTLFIYGIVCGVVFYGAVTTVSAIANIVAAFVPDKE